MAPHIKGIKVSNLPMVFSVPMTSGRRATIELLWGDHVLNVGEWSGVGKDIAALMKERDPAWLLPTSWSYKRLAGKLAPGEVPHEFDIPNPRHYGLDGVQYLPPGRGNYAELVHREFRDRMCRLWEHAQRRDPMSAEDVLFAFLDHHHERGGDLVPYLKKKFLRDYDVAVWHWPSPAMPTSHRPGEERLKGEMRTVVLGWMERRQRGYGGQPSFAELFGDKLPVVLKAMGRAGIRPKPNRGKRVVLGALHGACVALNKPIPLAAHWHLMLAQLFPEVKWSEKVKPIESERERQRAKDYNDAYLSMQDHLKELLG